ncbi:hypothetical protein [Christiangramia sabulilitoris]|uniref:Uncharacterized protein n=1 Tax=Christiangramia sabulilitoris TaxID=2583991 RepID=A0A550I056_9FLAO|nr:hypothetical protein [Christiangramia sabulilitoris]TRO64366.1 hypothetical protein FGM01_12815 [Christiangramia sabulilitoris]
MKHSKFSTIVIFIATLLFISCSKDENVHPPSDELVTLSFNMIIHDLTRQSIQKQSINDIPECSEDTPFFVEIILMQDDIEIVGSSQDPFRIDLASGQLFTKYSSELELPPGNYSLEHFSVHNEAGDLLWLAPKNNGDMALFSSDPLPIDIELLAGTKPYIDVPVLCYDNRDVNEYGYLFFELDATPLLPYCFFANYCDDSGRHYPARYSLEISINDIIIYSEVNTTGINEAGNYFAEPLCAAIPVLSEFEDDEEYIDYAITLLDWDEVYTINEPQEISGSLSLEDIEDQFDGDDNVEYEHIFINCDEQVADIDLPDFESAVFSDPTNITNPYYGPDEGYIYEYEGYEIEDGEFPDEPSEVIIVERRAENKNILGISTVIQRDYVAEDGVIIEDTDDWLAQDDEGNLWYMGELSLNYDDEGNFLDTEGSWETGVDGALPGYWLPGNPQVGQRYYQEFYEGEAEDWAEVIALNETVILDVGTFENVLVTKDINPFESGVYELKYYAPGTGFIKEEKFEDDELVEIVILTGIIVID